MKRVTLAGILTVAALSFALICTACGNTGAPAFSSSRDSIAAKGNAPLVLIVVGFAGDASGEGALPYQGDYNWHDLVFENAEGVSSYFSHQSNGAFTWVPAHETSAYQVDGNTNVSDRADDGIVHVTLPRAHGHWFAHERDQYGDDVLGTAGTYTYDAMEGQSGDTDPDFIACMESALAASEAYIDYSAYDADGDSFIGGNELGVGLVIAGYEIDGDWMHMLDDMQFPRIQAHVNNFDATAHGTHVFPNDAVVMAESTTSVPASRSEDATVDPSVMSIRPNQTSTLDHEFGHYLGLPDLYDTSYDPLAGWANWTPGFLSVMDTGVNTPIVNEDGTQGCSATSFDPFSLIELGWRQAQTVDKSGTYELRTELAAGGKNILRIETKNSGEYFLIENRQPTGQDAALSGQYGDEAAGGIVVWHIDETVYDEYLESNLVNYPMHRPAVTVQYLMDKSMDASGSHTLDLSVPSNPDTNTAFWSASSAQKRLGELGTDAFELWTYGKGHEADDLEARSYCGIKLRFPDESAETMNVEIELP